MFIKDWYKVTYADDELGDMLNHISFNKLYDMLGKVDIYELLGVGDSLVRERVFSKLAEIKGVDYDTIYDKWLNEE